MLTKNLLETMETKLLEAKPYKMFKTFYPILFIFSHLTTNQPVDNKVILTEAHIFESCLKNLLQIVQQNIFLLTG